MLVLQVANLCTDPAYSARYNPNHHSKIGWVFQILTHLATTSGIAIAASGASNFSKDQNDPEELDHDHKLQKTGYLMLLLVFFVNAAYAVYTIVRLQQVNPRSQVRQASKLMIWVIAACPAIGVRTIYGVVYAFNYDDADLNPTTGSFAVRFTLIFLMQLIAALLLGVGGTVSMNIRKEAEAVRSADEVPMNDRNAIV